MGGIAGNAKRMDCCPIANAIKRGGFTKRVIRVENKFTKIDRSEYKNPEWVNRFVAEVMIKCKKSGEISAKKCLEIMGSIES